MAALMIFLRASHDPRRLAHQMSATLIQVRVWDLMPGDLVSIATGESAVFIQNAPHPIWPHLCLVVWKLDSGAWSHDALDARQVVGFVRAEERELAPRLTRLREALLGGAH